MRRVAPEIMATIGPTLETAEHVRAAIEAGASWFRLPCGYRQRPHLQHARLIRQAAAQCGAEVRLLVDLPSSRPRTGKMEDLRLEIRARVRFFDPRRGMPPQTAGMANVPLPGLDGLAGKISRGQRIWFCDGRLEFVAEALQDHGLVACFERGEIPLKSFNSICLPDSDGAFTLVTPEDSDLLRAAFRSRLGAGLGGFFAGLVGRGHRGGPQRVRKCSLDSARVMAKIETAAAVREINSILPLVDAIMVARGDLGPVVEFVGLPEAQEKLVAAGRRGQNRRRRHPDPRSLRRSGRAAALRVVGLIPAGPSGSRRDHVGEGDGVQPAADRGHPFCPQGAALRDPASDRRAGAACLRAWRRR